MIESVEKIIKKHGMIKRGETVAAAVSGGVDSVVMLHVLKRLSGRLGFTLVVCHLNHALRGEESDRDFRFVRDLAKHLRISFVGGKLKSGELKGLKGLSVQEAARIKRYQFLEESALKTGAAKIALGHTMDDQAETVLMRLIKGSGLAGLAGIHPVRGKFIRPLIETSRKEVERYASAAGLEFRKDSSNTDTRYLRNDFRINLIPFIEKHYNPKIKETLARIASVIAKDDEFLNLQANGLFPDVVLERDATSLVLDRARIVELHESLLTRVFLLAVEVISEKTDLYSYHIKSFLKVIKGRRPNASVVLPDGLTVAREYDRVIISTEPGKEAGPFDYRLRLNDKTNVVEAGVVIKAKVLAAPPPEPLKDQIRRRAKKVREKKMAKGEAGPFVEYFDYEKIARPLRVRSFAPGDRMAPLGMGGRHKKLKDIFIEKKVPKSRRHTVPVVTAGGEIVWVVGIRRTDRYMVTDSTEKVLAIECTEAGDEAGKPRKESLRKLAKEGERGSSGKVARKSSWKSSKKKSLKEDPGDGKKEEANKK